MGHRPVNSVSNNILEGVLEVLHLIDVHLSCCFVLTWSQNLMLKLRHLTPPSHIVAEQGYFVIIDSADAVKDIISIPSNPCFHYKSALNWHKTSQSFFVELYILCCWTSNGPWMYEVKEDSTIHVIWTRRIVRYISSTLIPVYLKNMILIFVRHNTPWQQANVFVKTSNVSNST